MSEGNIKKEFEERIQKYTPITQERLLKLLDELPVIAELSDNSLMHVAMRLNESYQALERHKNDPDYNSLISLYRTAFASIDPGVILRRV